MYPEPPAHDWLYAPEAPLTLRLAFASLLGRRRFAPRIYNLGVRKHLDKNVEKFQAQPVTAHVPSFMASGDSSRVLFIPGANPQFKDKVTFVVKAFERPSCLKRLLKSLEIHYPGVPVVVLDDSKMPVLSDDVPSYVSYLRTEYDIGLSDGRNRVVDLVRTPFVVLMDDDFTLHGGTGLDELLTALDSEVFDIAGGCVSSPQGAAWSYSLVENEKTLTLVPSKSCDVELVDERVPAFSSPSTSCWRVDSILNFFMARTDFLKKVRWDPRLKVGEHEDFFLRVKDVGGRVAMCRGVSATNDNTCDSTDHYKDKRKRVFDFWVDFFLKRGIERMITPAGQYDLV
jgi:glycosyltransferase involved in cell wall biosynthesis